MLYCFKFILCGFNFFFQKHMYSLTHLFNKYILSTNYVPGIVLGPRDKTEDKTKSSWSTLSRGKPYISLQYFLLHTHNIVLFSAGNTADLCKENGVLKKQNSLVVLLYSNI